MTIRIDYSNMMSPAVDGGISERNWKRSAKRFRDAHKAVRELHASGTLGFFDLPDDQALLEQTLDYVRNAKSQYDDVVVLGIGGSALGPIALRTALRPYAWNSLSNEA